MASLKDKKEKIMRDVGAQRAWLAKKTGPLTQKKQSSAPAAQKPVRFGDLHRDGILSPRELGAAFKRGLEKLPKPIRDKGQYKSTARRDTIRDKRLK